MESVSEYSASQEKVCRLCSGESSEGYELFTTNSREKDELVKYICSMLNTEKDEAKQNKLRWLCKSCYAGACKTREFMHNVEVGQLKLWEQWHTSWWFKEQEIRQKQGLTYNKERVKTVKRRAETVSREGAEPMEINDKRNKQEPKTSAIGLGFSNSSNKTKPEIVYHKAASSLEAHLITPAFAEVRSLDDTLFGEIVEAKTTSNEDTTLSKQIYFICEYCRTAFIKPKVFLKHVATHKDCLYECTECLQNFNKKENFSEHQKQHGHKGIGLIENINTKEMSAGVIDLIMDENTTAEVIHCLEENSLKFICIECQKEFKSLYVVKSHNRAVHAGHRIFKCNFCAAKFKTRYNYNLHLAIHTGEKRYHCQTCSKTFKTKYECKRHNRVHTGEKPYNCSVCNKQFTFHCNFVTHKQLHTGERPYKCDLCKSNFSTISSLKKHRNIHLKNPLKNIYTGTQTQIAGSRNGLTTARNYPKQTIKPTSRSLLKSSCNSRTSNSAKTKLAQSLVNIEKVEILPPITIPDSAIISSNDTPMHFLNNKIQTICPRSNSYKFNCSVCQKKFKQSSALRKHQRTHTGERPYKCPMCPKSFSDPSNFKKHKNLHKNATHALEGAAQLNTTTMQELRQMLAEQSVEIMSDADGSISDPDPDRPETFSYSRKQNSFTLSPRGSEFEEDDDNSTESQWKRKTEICSSSAILDEEKSAKRRSPVVNDDTNKQVVCLPFKNYSRTTSYDSLKDKLSLLNLIKDNENSL